MNRVLWLHQEIQSLSTSPAVVPTEGHNNVVVVMRGSRDIGVRAATHHQLHRKHNIKELVVVVGVVIVQLSGVLFMGNAN